MSGNHPSELSPRQRMINMMYLVLTALLALNVSKEVLNSFFSVNLGIIKTTESVNDKNVDIYSDFANATNQVKVKPYKDLADNVKPESENIVEMIQNMKYSLVLAVDKRVFLGPESEFKDEDGDIIKDKGLELIWDELTPSQQKMTIGELSVKDDRNTSGDLFNPDNKQGSGRILDENNHGLATQLREKIKNYRIFLTDILTTAEDSNWIAKGSSNSIKSEIDKTLKLHDNYGKKKNESWEHYNFYDMPAVAALTILSKLQADIKNMESETISFLATKIDASSLKFSSAQAVTIPASNFVTKGDNFKSQIFLTAFDNTAEPLIYIGDYDSILESDGEYKYNLKDQLIVPLEVVNGQGMYTVKGNSTGPKTYRGLIKILQDDGYQNYPFNGKYMVADRMAVVSPTKMNLLYLEVDNPVSISVPGYQASDLKVTISNGSIKATKRSSGEYNVVPTKKGKSIVTVYVIKSNGKRDKMGDMEFRVKEVPDPIATINGKHKGVIDKSALFQSQGLRAELKDFEFEGIKYRVLTFDVTATYQGDEQTITQKGYSFSNDQKKMIKNSSTGSKVTFSEIRAKRRDGKGRIRDLNSIVFTIK